MSGRVAFMFDNLPSALPAAKAGKVRRGADLRQALALAPDLPTMEESGFPDFAIEGWYGIFAPARTPKPIVDKLSADHQQGADGAGVAGALGRRWASIRSSTYA